MINLHKRIAFTQNLESILNNTSRSLITLPSCAELSCGIGNILFRSTVLIDNKTQKNSLILIATIIVTFGYIKLKLDKQNSNEETKCNQEQFKQKNLKQNLDNIESPDQMIQESTNSQMYDRQLNYFLNHREHLKIPVLLFHSIVVIKTMFDEESSENREGTYHIANTLLFVALGHDLKEALKDDDWKEGVFEVVFSIASMCSILAVMFEVLNENENSGLSSLNKLFWTLTLCSEYAFNIKEMINLNGELKKETLKGIHKYYLGLKLIYHGSLPLNIFLILCLNSKGNNNAELFIQAIKAMAINSMLQYSNSWLSKH